ncbi:hypothetical protein ACPZ19_42245 [Amycolatopsis lurida]
MPFTIKDSFDTEGTRTTRESSLFADRLPVADSTAVARLRAGSRWRRPTCRKCRIGPNRQPDHRPVAQSHTAAMAARGADGAQGRDVALEGQTAREQGANRDLAPRG